jgi:hypothetical protein
LELSRFTTHLLFLGKKIRQSKNAHQIKLLTNEVAMLVVQQKNDQVLA